MSQPSLVKLRPSQDCLCPRLFKILALAYHDMDRELNALGPKSVREKANDLKLGLDAWTAMSDSRQEQIELLNQIAEQLHLASNRASSNLATLLSGVEHCSQVLKEDSRAVLELQYLKEVVFDSLVRLGLRNETA
ncbi:MAG: hypothetical protein KDB22_00080 [Planctomycetales bacterium]|nr:hypothetical protein [Planctomycetales bacterium]